MRTDSFTYSEILDQPRAWRETLAQMPGQLDRLARIVDLSAGEIVVPVGCGSSYYLALSAAMLFRSLARRLAEAQPASELLLHESAVFLLPHRYVTVGLSRSGETTETVEALRRVRERQLGPTVAITCAPESPIVAWSDAYVGVPEAQERSVVMTKSFTTMLLALQSWSARVGGAMEAQTQIDRLPAVLSAAFDRHAGTVAELGARPDLKSFVFLGSGALYGIANEAMLKVKEMSGLSSVAFHPLEFRHGPIATVGPGTLVTWFVSDEAEEWEVELLPELKRLGACILVLADRDDERIRQEADVTIDLQSGLPTLIRMPAYLALTQLLAYSRTVSLGLDPDKPRNLTKVVRLEA